MLNSDIEKARKAKSALFKKTRLSFGIKKLVLSNRSGLSRETIRRIEDGLKPWTIDSEVTYLTTMNTLIDEKQKEHPFLKLPAKPSFITDITKAHAAR